MKTASELQITPQELDALQTFIAFGKAGRLRHNPRPTNKRWHEPGEIDAETATMIFNMNDTGASADCGTVACIGGWVHVFMHPGTDIFAMNDYVQGNCSLALNPLFFPYDIEVRDNIGWSDLTVEQAVAAVECFIEGECKNPWLAAVPA